VYSACMLCHSWTGCTSTDASKIEYLLHFFFSLYLRLAVNTIVPFILYWRCQRNDIVVKDEEV